MSTSESKSKYRKGDIVLVGFPLPDEPTIVKRRPGVIISNDQLNLELNDVLMVPLTVSPQARTIQDTCVSIRAESHAGKAGGLRVDSVVDCTVIATIPKTLIVNKIGRFPEETMAEIARCLRRVLGDE